MTKLVHQVIIEPKSHPIGNWEIMVDAQTGEVLSVEDKAIYYRDHKGKEKN